MDVIIRPAQAEDADAIAELLAELGYPSKVGSCRRRIIELSRSAADRVFVAAEGDEISGLVSLHVMPVLHRHGNLCRITALVVAERHRGKGLGRLLTEAAIEFAKECGCFRLEVTSGSHRHGAHIFYRHVGFSPDGRRFVREI